MAGATERNPVIVAGTSIYQTNVQYKHCTRVRDDSKKKNI